MNFIKGVPDIQVLKDDKELFKITSVQYFDEDDDRVILKCAEDVPEFKRGFTCDFNCIFKLANPNYKIFGERTDKVKDLVLVFINKSAGLDDVAQFEYVFYK